MTSHQEIGSIGFAGRLLLISHCGADIGMLFFGWSALVRGLKAIGDIALSRILKVFAIRVPINVGIVLGRQVTARPGLFRAFPARRLIGGAWRTIPWRFDSHLAVLSSVAFVGLVADIKAWVRRRFFIGILNSGVVPASDCSRRRTDETVVFPVALRLGKLALGVLLNLCLLGHSTIPRRHVVANIVRIDPDFRITLKLWSIQFGRAESGLSARIERAGAIDGRHFVKQIRLLRFGERESFGFFGYGKLGRGKVTVAGGHKLVDRIGIGATSLVSMFMASVRIVRTSPGPSLVAVGIGTRIVDWFAWHSGFSSLLPTTTPSFGAQFHQAAGSERIYQDQRPAVCQSASVNAARNASQAGRAITALREPCLQRSKARLNRWPRATGQSPSMSATASAGLLTTISLPTPMRRVKGGQSSVCFSSTCMRPETPRDLNSFGGCDSVQFS